MIKFIRVDDITRYNLNFIYKTEILESSVNEKFFSLGGGKKVWFVKFCSSVSEKESWESQYFNSIEEANEWLDKFIEENA